MKTIFGSTLALAALGLMAGCSMISLRTPESRLDFSKTIIDNWSTHSRLQAARLIEEYGPPDQVRYFQLTWNEKGPWKKIQVWDTAPYYDSNAGPPNLEQTISYPVPSDSRQQLAAFSRRLRVSDNGAELSSLGTSEEENLLTLNLAGDILSGRVTLDEAHSFYERAQQLSLAGKSSPYMQRLTIAPPASQ